MITVFTRIPRPGHAWHPSYSADTREEVEWYAEMWRADGLEVEIREMLPETPGAAERSERFMFHPDA